MGDAINYIEETMIRFFLKDDVNAIEKDIVNLQIPAEIDFLESGDMYRTFANKGKIYIVFETREDYNIYANAQPHWV